MYKVYKLINKVNPILFLIILFAIDSFGMTLSSNEEQYLAYTKKAFDPTWMQYSSFLDDFPGTRLFFQSMFGWLFLFFDFETVALIGRALLVILITMPLYKIIKYFNLTTISVLIVFPFWLPVQTLFAGGWMIGGGFETKVFAYIFALWGIYFFFTKQYWFSIIFQILSFHFHILVGGWITVVIAIMFLFEHKFRTVKYYLVYLGAILPFCFYLLKGLFLEKFDSHGVNLDWVYTYYRNPHHIGLFKTMDYFFERFFPGILNSSLLFVLHLFVYRLIKNEKIQKLSLFNIVLFSQQIIMIIVAYYDKNGTILKTYPFRTNVIYYLFSLIEIVAVIIYKKDAILAYLNSIKKPFRISIQMICVIVFLLNLQRFYHRECKYLFTGYYSELNTLVEYAKTTPVDANFMLLGVNGSINPFPRKAERSFYVLGKFIPTRKADIYKWYMRMLEQEKIKEDINYLNEIYKKEGIDYLITYNTYDVDFMSLTYKNGAYKVYKLKY